MSQFLPVPMSDDPSVPHTTARLLIDMVKPFSRRMIGFFVITFVGTLAWAAAPFAVSKIVTELSHTHNLTSHVWGWVVAYGACGLLNELCWRSGEVILRSCKPQMVESVRWRLFAALLKRPYSFFIDASSGRLGHWVNQVTETSNTFIDTTIWTVWSQLSLLLVAAAFLFATHWSLAILFIAWMLVLLAYNIQRGKRYSTLIAKSSDEESKAAGMIVDALSNHVSVRAFTGENVERQRLAHQQHLLVTYGRRAWAQNIVTNFVKGQSVAYVTTIALAIVVTLYAHNLIPLGAIILFIAYFGQASSAVWQLAWALDSYYRDFATIQNALDGFKGTDERRVTTETEPEAWVEASVSLDLAKVSFAYAEQPTVMVINKLTLLVAPREKVGIVGPSGAGKSTLVGLLLGFFEPIIGEISVNGKSTAEYGPQIIRASSSYVPQDTSLFNRTVRENILYARPLATDQEIIAALSKAQALSFVEKLPHGLDSVVGERGVKLSGGQRQRIAIARAILQDAPLLILDEATSALDSISEQAIQKALFELMQDRTTIVIAHRLSTLKNLDRIVVLDDGAIREQGSHDQLIAHGGLYADMWKRQKNGFIVD